MAVNQQLWLDADGLRVGGTQLWTGGGVGIGTNSIAGALTVGNTATFAGNVTVTGNLNIGNVTTVNGSAGIFLNSTTGRNQITAYGFTFNQDGDVLTPTNKTRLPFAYTGSNQIFTVPDGVSFIYVKLWGAGGGQGRVGAWSYGSDGGGGGHTRALLPVTPGTELIVVVGSGGFNCNNTVQQYGGGGPGGGSADNQYGGQGGGYCGVFTPGVIQANALAIAGGGGGGGSLLNLWYNMAIGGAGGGVTGQTGASSANTFQSTAGGGGTQSAGGFAGTQINGGSGATAGAALQGGSPGSNTYGGGGGGGYWGGGGGAYSTISSPAPTVAIMAGGGGGSGFISPTAVYGQTYQGNYRTPALFWDPDLPTRAASAIECPAYGAQNTQNNIAVSTLTGGHAYAVIYY